MKTRVKKFLHDIALEEAMNYVSSGAFPECRIVVTAQGSSFNYPVWITLNDVNNLLQASHRETDFSIPNGDGSRFLVAESIEGRQNLKKFMLSFLEQKLSGATYVEVRLIRTAPKGSHQHFPARQGDSDRGKMSDVFEISAL